MSNLAAVRSALWVDAMVGYDRCCGFFVSATSAALPPPIAWTSCDSSVQPPGLRCRQMVANWGPPGSDPQPFGVGTASSVAADGTVMLAAERHVDVGGQTASFELVAEANSPVRQAMIWTLPTKCWAQIRSIQDGKVIYGVYENGGETGGGAFGGAVDSLYPTSFIKFADKLTHDYSAGTLGVVDDATITLYAWQSTLTASAGGGCVGRETRGFSTTMCSRRDRRCSGARARSRSRRRTSGRRTEGAPRSDRTAGRIHRRVRWTSARTGTTWCSCLDPVERIRVAPFRRSRS